MSEGGAEDNGHSLHGFLRKRDPVISATESLKGNF